MMDLPNYSTWEKTDKKVFSEPHFGRTQSLNSYGKTNGDIVMVTATISPNI